MIISRTPIRMSFAGGGSDIASFYEKSAGAVISTTIDKYIFVTINTKFDDGIRVAYSQNEDVTQLAELRHPIVKTALELMGEESGIEITTIADIPSKGTGLGSSSSFTVGLLNALSAYQGRGRGKKWLAKKACHVEIDLCGEPIGKQDQYAASYGGLNMFDFLSDGTTKVTPINITSENRKKLEDNTLLFFTGITRKANSVLEEQSKSIESSHDTFSVMREMVEQVPIFKDIFETGNVDDLGRLLHEGWLMKKSLVGAISNQTIDDLYTAALQAGASGGKILGAGSGGFLMVYVPEDKHSSVRKALADLKELRFNLDSLGSQVIGNYR